MKTPSLRFLMARSTEQGSGGLSPPRQLQIEQMGADSTTACTSPRPRSSRARCRSGPSFLASFEARVCERDSPAPVCRASACLSGQDSSLCVSCPASVLRTPGRPRAPAAARTKSAQARSAHALHAQLRLRLRGERGRRVCPHFVCVRVWSRCLYFLSLLDIFERNIAV